jgi:hypothetical protein
MFIQVIQGRVSDAEEIRAALDRWVEQEAPGAIGWLGTTAGVSDDGTFIALVRFESEEAARRNSDRPDQHQWWMETAKLFSGDVTFRDCRATVEFGRGGADDAGFVQVIQGRVRDVERMRALNDQFQSVAGDFRPDVIGGVVALHGDGGYTNAVYFTSEEAAREGERQEPPAALKAMMDEEAALHEGEPTFIDLREPWLQSPR